MSETPTAERAPARQQPACVACGTCLEPLFDSVVPGFAVYRCRSCGSARTWPPVADSDTAKWYPMSYYGVRNVRFNPLFEFLTRWFRARRARKIRVVTTGGSVLDVGCGRGLTLAALRSVGYRTVGVEISDTAARHATEKLGLDVRVGDFLRLPFEDEQFDALILWHSLEHFSDPEAALGRAHRLLKPGGLIFIAVPNIASWQARFTGRQWFHLDVPRHYVHYSWKGLRQSLERNRFRIVETDHFSLEQNPYGWIQSLLNLALDHNLLYSILKDPQARSHRLRDHPLQVLASIAGGFILLPVSMLLMLLETIARRGGTVEVYAQKARS